MYMNTRLTPYLEVVGEKEVLVPKVRRVCPNHPSTESSTDKFCGKCGAEIVNEEYQVPKKITPQDVLHEFENDRMWIPEYLDLGLILPNDEMPRSVFMDDSGGGFHIEDPAELKRVHLEWFQEKYADIIKRMEEVFEKENVQVRWGVVSYWS